jgi:orotate phosphoribosyltransferase
MTLTLLALAAGATVLIVVDVLRTGGIVIEAVGVAAAAAAVGLLVLAARNARPTGGS